MRAHSILLPLLLGTMAACSLPGEGPKTSAILDPVKPANGPSVPFSLVELNPRTMQRLDEIAAAQPTTSASLPAAAAIGRIGPGDLVAVSIWEAQTSQVQPNPGDKPSVQINARVEPSGAMTIPFAGRVRAAGLTPAQLETVLVKLLRAQTIEPQVSVVVAEDQTNAIILAGEVLHPGRVPLGAAAQRALDVIALGGGVRIPAEKAVVRIERGTAVVQRPLGRILADPLLNERLGPGDRVTVLPLNRRFYAFGAVNRPGEQEFPAEAQNLIQALGRVAGLQDNRADREGLFVFRTQNPKITAQIGTPSTEPEPNVVYHLDLRDPNAFFVAKAFKIQPEDVLFVSNSPIADFSKVLSLVTGLGSLAATPRNFGMTP